MKSSHAQFWRWGALALLTGGLVAAGLTGCNSHPVEYTTSSGNFGVSVDYSPRNAEAVDILWVIDNSGSMCEEQTALASNFDAFIADIANKNIDFQMGVTTTQDTPDFIPSGEFAAEYGKLQSTPNPVPSQFRSCATANAVETALSRAVGCTTNPDAYRTTLSSGESACLDDRTSAACQSYCGSNTGEAWCTDDGDGSFTFDPIAFKNAIFPPSDAYRNIDLILRRSDYENTDGTLRTDDLRADFSCMSFVGTRGWSFEKGLGAAMEATSVEKVGRFYDPEAEPPADAPNYGLIRKDSSFSLIFVTDENDCSYDNDRSEEVSEQLKIREQEVGACLDDVCEFANSTQFDEATSPLLPPEEVAQTIVDQLSRIKDRNFSLNEFIVASIHGQPDRYAGPSFTPDQCGMSSYEPVPTTCSGDFGTAYSGDRYQRFVDSFEEDRRFPQADDPVKGKICIPGFSDTLREIGELIARSNTVCITEPVYRCQEASQCPNPSFLANAGIQPTCEPFAASGETYCRNAIQLIMSVPEDAPQAMVEDPAAALANTGYCVSSTIDTEDFPESCVVSYDQYTLDNCPANDAGLTVNWVSDTPFQEIGEFNVEINYAVTPITNDGNSNQ